MENRKHPESDINKQTPLYLSLGLVLACGLMLMAFEWRAFTETIKTIFVPPPQEMVREEIINYTPPPPQAAPTPPPPTVIEVIQLVEKEEEVRR